MKALRLNATALTFLVVSSGIAQSIPTPAIIDVDEDDRLATIYWNSKTNVYDSAYDPDKQAGVFSYLIEWGKQSDGFTHSQVTPYRAHQIQPLDVGTTYIARVYNLDAYGNKSAASATVSFQHDDSRVLDMANRLNGGFDDMNLPMGPFDETKWNQAYSGCTTSGKLSQHINSQFHGHNVVASGVCDRGIAASRFRHEFDFTNRTGVIEFDLDGSKRGRQLWYLDIMPADRKRDLPGHTDLITDFSPIKSDPPFLLRFVEMGNSVQVQLANADGQKTKLQNIYQNGACGEDMRWCPNENLAPLTNVRRHWRIELSKTDLKVFINDILIIDGSLQTSWTPNGLPYEIANINWLFFSYNTPKENMIVSMVHWDNFGIDAPLGYQPTTVVHNYTDGLLGSTTAPIGNEQSMGMPAYLTQAGVSTINIPDQINDQAGSPPTKAELMFTMQGNDYNWTASDHILVNGHHYDFDEPSSAISGILPEEILSSYKPYSALLDIDPAHLVSGNNVIEFFLNDTRLLNVHIELTYPIATAPVYSPPDAVHPTHMADLMEFQTAVDMAGPGIVFREIDSIPLFFSEFSEVLNPTNGSLEGIVKQTPVCGMLHLKIEGNTEARLAAMGTAKGIAYYEILMDQNVIETVQVDADEAIAYFEHDIQLNTLDFSDGSHELFVRAYDVDGRISQWDSFQANAQAGEYIPTTITIDNSDLTNCGNWSGCAEDIDNNGYVNVDDFLLLNSSFGTMCTCPEDINGNGTVDIDDFLIFNSAFGSTCQ